MKRMLLLMMFIGAFLSSCTSSNEPLNIIPHPNKSQTGDGTFSVKGCPIRYDSRIDDNTLRTINTFATQLATISGGENTVSATDVDPDKGFRFLLDDTIASEGYKLNISTSGVEVRASDFRGFLYALQSIKQLLPVAIYGKTPAPELTWELPAVKIEDAPRFGYRGLHLDVARHFFDVKEVKRYIDMMVIHKLNTLHWHLTDDQGWRIEIKRYPRLTKIGSIRKGTVIRKEWDKGNYDGIPYGGFYTQEEIREVVNYAAANGITVIPEIDLPGHMLAALTAYPELGCTGGPYEVWGRWGVADDVLCPGTEKMFQFIEGVLTEVMDLFPSKYIHIGGDECPKVRWQKCPRCQAKIKELGIKGDDQHTAEHYLQSYVITRVEKFLNNHGRQVIGWDEILEGGLAPNATVMSWRGSTGGITAAQQGHDVIMTPNTHFYIDYYQSLDREKEPFGIGGYIPVERVYSYDPAFVDQLTPEQQKHILGVQANLWTEYIATPEHLEYMLLPRLSALSEVQWCNPEIRDYNRFLSKFRMHKIYEIMGYNYAKHIFGVNGSYAVDPQKGCIVITLSTQGNEPIYYTLDGSIPTTASKRYTQPVEIFEDCKFHAAVLREDMQTPTYEREFRFSKSTGCPIVLNSKPTRKYTYYAPQNLVDGHHGGTAYTSGAWCGFLKEPCDATIDMEGAGSYSQVEVEALIEKGEWIFPPSKITVSTSEDNTTFNEIASLTLPAENAQSPEGVKVYTVEFPKTEARYLRVVVETVNPIPAWHGAAGEESHLFLGEISVN